MAYDQHLADRLHQIMEERKVNYFAKPMMGGLIFMVEEKMCFGIHYDKKKETDLLMARIGEEASVEALKRDGCHPMDFTGRPMRGYVFVDPDGFDMDEDLEHWMDLCLAFNPMAKTSKKRKK